MATLKKCAVAGVVLVLTALISLIALETQAIANAYKDLQEIEVAEQTQIEIDNATAEQAAQVAQKAAAEAVQAKLENPRISSATFKYQGVINHKGYKYTYYSSKVLHHKNTYQWHTVDGYYYDEDGYVVMASSEFDTPHA